MEAWIQITAGRGPSECERVVAKALQLLEREAKELQIDTKVLEVTPGYEKKSYSSVFVAVSGGNIQVLLDKWHGTLQWSAQSPFRPNHKRKNWFVGVEHFLPPDEQQWDLTKLKFETMRGTGPGGQNVNKVATAVRITHLDSGIVVTAREERSQLANRKLALAKLKSKIEAIESSKQLDRQQNKWEKHNSLERGNPTRVIKAPLT